MSLLLLGPQGKMGEAVIMRLVGQGDDVRVVELDREVAERWRTLGARVAQGAVDDPDLIERAAQNCRTIVVFEVDGDRGGLAALEAAVAAARSTSVDRVVVTGTAAGSDCRRVLGCSGLAYVWLTMERGRGLRRRETPAVAIAEAIDAADDLAGNPKLELDLSNPRAWIELGLEPRR
ncbi:MAG: NAD(P)H-binding protein [Actinomycetota bacterium]|nr:NAD(P)H-binding protein [Actinomycetota bacterium]